MRRFLSIPLFGAGVLLLLAAPAGAVNWISAGPPGGTVRALAADPSDPERVYLGTADGLLFRSDDAGRNWRPLSPGFPRRGVSLDDIVVDDRGAVLVGFREVDGPGGGVARSRDGGQTFTLSPGIAGESVRALALAPSDPEVVACGTLTGVFLSGDGGRSWRRITPAGSPDLRNFESLAFDPADPRVLYAGTWHLAWKTVDGGATWTPVHQGMIDDTDVMTLTVDRRDPHVLWATSCTGIYRSADAGARWAKLPGIPEPSRRTRAFLQLPDEPARLLAGTTKGLWASENGGASWRRTTAGAPIVNALVALKGGVVLLGTEDAGVLKSADRGRTWTESNAGFSVRFVSRLAFDAQRRLLFAADGDGDGVFFAPAAGGPWARLEAGLEGRRVLSLALLGGTILAGTDDGVFARGPQARAWERLPTAPGGREAHPRVTGLVVLPPARLVAATPGGVLTSADGGRTWTRCALGDPNAAVRALTALPDDPRGVVAATSAGVFRSRDGGATWFRVSAGPDGVTLHALAALPAGRHALLAVTTGGLFRSDDRGASWRRVGGGAPRTDLSGLAVHPDGRTLYVSDFDFGGIFRSTDAGRTWERLPAGDLPTDRVWALGLDPDAPERLFAATPGGLFVLAPTPVALGDAELP